MLIQKRFHRSGFSLFELVVAISLIILLLVSLSFLFTSGIGVYHQFGKGISPFQEARLVFQKIESDINSLVEGSNNFRGNTGPTRMDFLSLVNPEGTTLALRYQYNSNSKTLERFSETANTFTLPGTISNNTELVGERIAACTFSFYDGTFSGLLLTGNSPQWTVGSGIPAAIKIDLSIEDRENPAIVENFSRIFAVRNRG